MHFFSNEVTVSYNKMADIEKSARKQSPCEEWHAERKKRITSSNFGKIVKLRLSASVTNSSLYSKFIGNRFKRYGLAKEQSALREYELYKESKGENFKVCTVGIVIHPQHHFLAACADGLVQSEGKVVGLVEVKNLLSDKNNTLKKPTAIIISARGRCKFYRSNGWIFLCVQRIRITSMWRGYQGTM